MSETSLEQLADLHRSDMQRLPLVDAARRRTLTNTKRLLGTATVACLIV